MTLQEIKAKIFEYVNTEFNIENVSELEAVKESLGLEKIDTLNDMLKDYKKAVKKAVNAEKRKQAQREAQKDFKKLATSVKVGEFEKYENDAKSKNLTISQYVKKSLESFIGSKTVSVDKVLVENETKALTAKYEALKAEIRMNKEVIENHFKYYEKMEIFKTDSKAEIERLKSVKPDNSKSEEVENLKAKLKDITEHRDSISDMSIKEGKENNELRKRIKELESENMKLRTKSFWTKLSELFT
jgi:hypothetical protein